MNNEKVLLVTGNQAKDIVERNSKKSSIRSEVKVLPIDIASFMNLRLFSRQLKNKNLENFSMIIVPGLAEFDLEKAEEELGIPVFKGPTHAADIQLVLDHLNEIELSKEKPASDYLREEISSLAKKQLKRMKMNAEKKFEEEKNFRIGRGKKSILIGPDFPPRIVAEITDAPRLGLGEIIEKAENYVQEGAEIIDIGMTTEGNSSQKIPRIISTLRKNFDTPLSIDTTDKAEIGTAIENGIDLIVSIDESTVDEFENLQVPAVLIPRDTQKKYYHLDYSDKIRRLEEILHKAEDLNYKNPIVDPILNPVGKGFTKSLMAFFGFREKNPEVPMFMGLGNVIELFDADSIGMTALLIGIANEINLDFVLSVEASDKTQGNISEISQARDMMLLSEKRNTVPKDLGLDLLRFKEKRKTSDPYDRTTEEKAKIFHASSEKEFDQDSKGYFRIFVRKSKIVAFYYGPGNSRIVIKGETAEEICNEIIKRNLIDKISHAAYLGRELQKAEIAAKNERSYIQEGDLF